ncbi:MAG: putative lipid II flippase FtsW [Solirubrobacterales bacterium]|nr:putative lipid II flippase FtsW [Solirubrobacterales bacterium]
MSPASALRERVPRVAAADPGHARVRPKAGAPPIEHRMLITATLCLLAFGSVMVYSASSPLGVMSGRGFGTGTFVRYLVFGAIGLIAMQVLSRRGLALFDERSLRLFLIGSCAFLLLVLVPGVGREVNGARRWFGAGPIQFQPSELVKLALVLYAARYLADHPKRIGSGLIRLITPIAIVAGPACLLIVLEPDMGTALVIMLTLAALLLAAGVPARKLALLAALVGMIALLFVLTQPYQRARLESFLHPWSSKSTAGFQAVQGQIALGSGGVFGVGLGRSVQKIYYLPEAPTDFILAVVGEELGVMGIGLVAVLYGMVGYAGFRTARRARDRYAKLLASGLTSLILCQGVLNIFVVLGLAPLTGVPLPFISYAPTNLCVMLASVGLLLNIARPVKRLAVVEAPSRDPDADRDRRRRDRRTRRPGAGGRRRAAG